MPLQRRTTVDAYVERLAKGDVPKGYDRLTKRQKKVARLVAAGHSLKYVCDKVGLEADTFYRWRRAHPLFREYLYKRVLKNATDLEGRLEEQVVRSAQVIDEALDFEDIYLRTSVAQNVLKGRGRWKSNVEKKVEGNITSTVKGEVKVHDMGASKELIQTLVDGLVSLAGGVPLNEKSRKVIDVKKLDGKLPEIPEEAEGATAS